MNISKWKLKAMVVKDSHNIYKASVSLNCKCHSFLNGVYNHESFRIWEFSSFQEPVCYYTQATKDNLKKTWSMKACFMHGSKKTDLPAIKYIKRCREGKKELKDCKDGIISLSLCIKR